MAYRKLFAPKERSRCQKKFYMDNLESETIMLFSKLISTRYKTLLPIKKNTTISFNFVNWPLPYLKLLKKIGIAKLKNCDRLELDLSHK